MNRLHHLHLVAPDLSRGQPNANDANDATKCNDFTKRGIFTQKQLICQTNEN